MPTRKKRPGGEAVVSVLIRFLHPGRVVAERFPNHQHKQRLHGCILQRQQYISVRGENSPCWVVTHPDHVVDGSPIEFHSNKRNFRVDAKGPIELLFAGQEEEAKDDDNEDGGGEGREEILFPTSTTVDDLRNVVEVDNDNLPAPENIPEPTTGGGTTTTANLLEAEWGHTGICHRRAAGCLNHKPMLNFPYNPNGDDLYVKLFLGLFPRQWLEEVLLPNTNKLIVGDPLTLGEFVWWIGMWMIMSTVDGALSRKDFWSTTPINMYECAQFRFTGIMSRFRFDNILAALSFIDPAKKPDQVDNDRRME